MFGTAVAYRDKYRLQPCEPKPRWLRHDNNSHTAIKTNNCLRITKPQNDKKPVANNRKRTTIFLKPSRAITPPADC